MSNVWNWIKTAAKRVYDEFRQYPQYGWPAVAFVAGWAVGHFWR